MKWMQKGWCWWQRKMEIKQTYQRYVHRLFDLISWYKNSSSYKDEYRQGIKCSFCTVDKESSLNEDSIEQTNFLKLSASIAGTDRQHITETLSTVITFQNKHLNIYIWMKETKLYVLRGSMMWQVLQQTLFYRPNDLQSDHELIRQDETLDY